MTTVPTSTVSATTTMNPTSPSTATPTSTATAGTGVAMLPQFATTPKRGNSRKPKREPSILLAYAIEHGGRVDLTDAGRAELAQRGLPKHRIPCAVYDVRKYFGKAVTAERNGRAVSAYVVSL